MHLLVSRFSSSRLENPQLACLDQFKIFVLLIPHRPSHKALPDFSTFVELRYAVPHRDQA